MRVQIARSWLVVLVVAASLTTGFGQGAGAPAPAPVEPDERETVVPVAQFEGCAAVGVEFPGLSPGPGSGPFTPAPWLIDPLWASFLPIFGCTGLTLGDEDVGAAGVYLGLAPVEPVAGATSDEVDSYFEFGFASTITASLQEWLFGAGVGVMGVDAQIRFTDLAVLETARAEVRVYEDGNYLGGADSLAPGPSQTDPATVWGLYVYDWDEELLRLHVLRLTPREVLANGVGRVFEGGATAPFVSSHQLGFDMSFELDAIEPAHVSSP